MSEPRHLVLVGLSGAGKSVVGRRAAAALGCRCVDVDQAIELREGQTIAELFAARGVAAFRELERQRVLEALRAAPGVIAPGAGWAAQPGALEEIGAGPLLIHLKVSPGVAADRLAGTAAVRPLLGPDPRAGLESLAAERAASYRRAEVTIETDGRPEVDVARDVVAAARRLGGW